jgi:putative ABC transport system ATP-binding protein
VQAQPERLSASALHLIDQQPASEPAAQPTLEVDGLRFGFSGGHGRPPFAIEVDQLEIQPGECLIVRGESGSGKSTLFSFLSLNRTVRPDAARHFRFRGKEIVGLDDSLLSALRAWSIGFIFQSQVLYDDQSGLDNIQEPLRRLYPRWPAERRAALAMEALRMFFAEPGQLQRVAATVAGRLSGGERQRVSLARSIVHRPAVLFADEPTGGLDTGNVELLRRMLVALQAEGTTVLLISHDSAFLHQLEGSLARRGLTCQTRWMWAADPDRPHVRQLTRRPPDVDEDVFRLRPGWRHTTAPCLRCGLSASEPLEVCSCGLTRDPAARACPRCGLTGGGDFCGGCGMALFPIYGAS